MNAAQGLKYRVASAEFATDGSAGSMTTALFLYVPDTAGLAAQLTGLAVGSADATPVEKDVIVQLARVDDISGGSAGTGTAATIFPMKSRQRASALSAKHTCTAEPSTYGTVEPIGFHSKNGIYIPDGLDGPIIEQDQGLGCLLGCQDATVLTLTVTFWFTEIG